MFAVEHCSQARPRVCEADRGTPQRGSRRKEKRRDSAAEIRAKGIVFSLLTFTLLPLRLLIGPKRPTHFQNPANSGLFYVLDASLSEFLGRGHLVVVERALAAVGDEPVLHVVYRGIAPFDAFINRETGSRRDRIWPESRAGTSGARRQPLGCQLGTDLSDLSAPEEWERRGNAAPVAKCTSLGNLHNRSGLAAPGWLGSTPGALRNERSACALTERTWSRNASVIQRQDVQKREIGRPNLRNRLLAPCIVKGRGNTAIGVHLGALIEGASLSSGGCTPSSRPPLGVPISYRGSRREKSR